MVLVTAHRRSESHHIPVFWLGGLEICREVNYGERGVEENRLPAARARSAASARFAARRVASTTRRLALRKRVVRR